MIFKSVIFVEDNCGVGDFYHVVYADGVQIQLSPTETPPFIKKMAKKKQ